MPANSPSSSSPTPPIPILALRAREAAIALGISERTLWTLTHAGEIPHVRIGTAVLHPVKELTEFLTTRAKMATGAPDSAPQVGADWEDTVDLRIVRFQRGLSGRTHDENTAPDSCGKQ